MWQHRRLGLLLGTMGVLTAPGGCMWHHANLVIAWLSGRARAPRSGQGTSPASRWYCVITRTVKRETSSAPVHSSYTTHGPSGCLLRGALHAASPPPWPHSWRLTACIRAVPCGRVYGLACTLALKSHTDYPYVRTMCFQAPAEAPQSRGSLRPLLGEMTRQAVVDKSYVMCHLL